METKIELYKILWDQLSGEMNRFWVRYNVLLGVQLAFVITLLVPLLTKGPKEHIWAAYLFLIILSSVTVAIVSRAIKTFKFNILAIKKFEELHGGNEINLFTSIGAELSNEDDYLDIKDPKAYQLSIYIPVLMLIVWSGFFVNEIDQALKLIEVIPL